MISKKLDKDTEDFKVFMEFWQFRQKYYLPETDEDWQNIILEADKLSQKYKNRIMTKLVMLHLDDAEKRFKDGKKN